MASCHEASIAHVPPSARARSPRRSPSKGMRVLGAETGGPTPDAGGSTGDACPGWGSVPSPHGQLVVGEAQGHVKCFSSTLIFRSLKWFSRRVVAHPVSSTGTKSIRKSNKARSKQLPPPARPSAWVCARARVPIKFQAGAVPSLCRPHFNDGSLRPVPAAVGGLQQVCIPPCKCCGAFAGRGTQQPPPPPPQFIPRSLEQPLFYLQPFAWRRWPVLPWDDAVPLRGPSPHSTLPSHTAH